MIFRLFGSKRERLDALEIISVASEFIPKMRSKFAQEGENAILEYATGTGEVAGLLADRFKVSVPAALVLNNIDSHKLRSTAADLLASVETTRRNLNSEVQATRALFHRMTFASLLYYNFCSVKLLAISGPQDLRQQATYLEKEFALFARVLGEIAVGIRDPNDACLSHHQLNAD